MQNFIFGVVVGCIFNVEVLNLANDVYAYLFG